MYVKSRGHYRNMREAVHLYSLSLNAPQKALLIPIWSSDRLALSAGKCGDRTISLDKVPFWNNFFLLTAIKELYTHLE